MLSEARAAIDPDGFGRLEVRARPAIGWARSDALSKLTWMVTCKGGLISDITVGDCLELTAAPAGPSLPGSAGRPLFYALLKDTGVLPAARQRGSGRCGSKDAAASSRSSTSPASSAGPYGTCW